jgi:hypothetical protein
MLCVNRELRCAVSEGDVIERSSVVKEATRKRKLKIKTTSKRKRICPSVFVPRPSLISFTLP